MYPVLEARGIASINKQSALSIMHARPRQCFEQNKIHPKPEKVKKIRIILLLI